MDGILLVHKPSGWSSFDVVAKVRGLIRQSNSRIVEQSDSPIVAQPDPQTIGPSDYKTIRLSDRKTPMGKVKVGHTGTLDPLATGLMIVVVGSYCKRAQEFSKLDKTYEVTMRLGMTSTTGDEEGEKTLVSDAVPSLDRVKTVLDTFVGTSMQTPPIYSAVKVNGQRAYKLAREGKPVVIEPREITIYQISDSSYAYPEVKFTARVSSGTYIRSLVQDIGAKLGCGAYMSGLVRTKVANFELASAFTIEQLQQQPIEPLLITIP